MRDGSGELLDRMDAPAAACDATGTLLHWNAAFEEWLGGAPVGRVEVHGARGTLTGPDGEPRAVLLVGLVGGGWLALGRDGEASGTVATVASAVAGRLGRVELALASNAEIGLREQPGEPAARCLRETLAIAAEIRRLRRQIAAFDAQADGEHEPVCLFALAREAVAALRPAPIRLDPSEGDSTVELDRARFFAVLVAVLEELGRASTADAPLVAAIQGGDFVRLQLRGAAVPGTDTPAIASARRVVAAVGGRVLVEPGARLTIELPAFARELREGVAFGTVLTADDDESALAMMGAVLRKAGFRVLAARDGVAASSLLRQHRGELVALVVDAVLPGRSGLELASEARRASPDLPVLLVSGHPSDLLGGADLVDLPILPKPFGARTLADTVRALVDAPS